VEKLRVARAIAVAGLALCIGAGACAQPRLEDLTRDLARSVPRTESARIGGSIAVRVTDVNVKGAPEADLQAAGAQFGLPVVAARFVAQPSRDRWAIVGPTDTVGLANGRVIYARRKTNGPADKRPWVRLELERLDDIDVPELELLLANQDPGVLATLSPQFVLDLLHGVLTGSVKERTLKGGDRVVNFNTSIDKMERELKLSEDEKDDRERLLRASAITGDIFSGVARLRPDGSLSRLKLELREQPDKRTRVNLDVELNLDAGPETPVSLIPPKRDATIRVGSLAALRASFTEQLSPQRVAGLPQVPA